MRRKALPILGVLVAVGAVAVLLYFRSASSKVPVLALELEGTLVSYSEVTDLEDGGQMQMVILGESEHPNADAFGMSVYSNPDRLSAEEWVRREWDPQDLLVLEHFSVPFGDAVLIRDANAWADSQPYLVEFPTLLVASAGDQIITVDRLSGVETSPERILELLDQARRP